MIYRTTRFLLPLALFAFLVAPLSAAEGGWTALFNGKNLDGWKAAENPDSIHVEDGAIVCNGPRAHLFYTGDVEDADFRNFHLKATIKTRPGTNSGLFFHTKYQESGWPAQGYEVQVNNSQPQHDRYYEFKKTGSLYSIRNVFGPLVEDDEWFTMEILVTGHRIRILVNEQLVVDYTEPVTPVRDPKKAGCRVGRGTFAIQCHDPDSTAYFKDIRVKPLPDDVDVPPAPADVVDEIYTQITNLNQHNFPLIDLHVHLKGGLTLEEALANSRATGIYYGIAPNCGVGFPITDDAGIEAFVEEMRGKPIFVGMQAEGREWVDMFSPEAIAKFDYVFTDAMTFTDNQGRRMRLWMPDETFVDDPEDFMEMLVDRIEGILNNEPINIYVNATYLPACIKADYDKLWTEERMDRVIKALLANDVALEISARNRIPSPAFIKRAKAAGVLFTFGTNNGGRELGRLEYCLEMIDECGLKSTDMWVPGKPR